MKKFLIATAALASVAVVAPANAADLPVKAPPVVMPALYNWSGIYIGPQGGAIMGQWSRVQEAEGGEDTDFEDFGHPLHGGFAGGEVGFNWQAPGNRWVLGVEGALSWAELEESLTCAADGNPPQNDFHRFCGSRINGFAEARARIGYAFGPTGNFLVYITGGGVWARESELFRNSAPGEALGSVAFGSFQQWATVPGWTVGGGAEWGITPYLSLKGEVLYVDLNEHTFSTVGCGTVAREDICDDPLKIKHTFILARMALNWRFDWGKGKGPAPVVARY